MNCRIIWAVARNSFAVWRRSPWAIAAALVPSVTTGALVGLLTIAVGRQPVALVVNDPGPQAVLMHQILQSDNDAYVLHETDARTAAQELANQQVAAVIVIPSDFDKRVATDNATVEVVVNNVDYDFADDVRRRTTRSVAEFDAPDFSVAGEVTSGVNHAIIPPNPYRIAIAEHDLRVTNVSLGEYEIIPILALLVINAGVLSTSLLLAEDFSRGTARLLMATPASRASVVAGRGVGSMLVTLSMAIPLTILGAGLGLIKPPGDHWFAVIALLLVMSMMSVGFGLVLGTWIRRPAIVTMAGLNVVTYLFYLGGGFTTIAFLPSWLQTVAQFVPTSYGIAGLRQALFYPDLVGFGTDVAVMASVAVGALLLGSIAFARGMKR